MGNGALLQNERVGREKSISASSGDERAHRFCRGEAGGKNGKEKEAFPPEKRVL